MYDSNQKMLSLGRKLNELLNKYFQTNNKKEFTANFNKWIEEEKVKRAKKILEKAGSKSQKKKAKIVEKQMQQVIEKVEKEVLKKVVQVRKNKKLTADKVIKQRAEYIYKINDRVRVLDSDSVGTIDNIDKKKVTINYGFFTTKTTIDKLELVEDAK